MLSKPLRIGLFLSSQGLPEMDMRARLKEHLHQVALARELGFTSVLAGQHFLAEPYKEMQPIPFLARVAAEADGMIVGTGIALLSLLNPVQFAEEIATLDVISGGRLVVGVGIGYRTAEIEALGFEGPRGKAFEAKLEVVRGLLGGREMTACGHGYRLQDARLALHPDVVPPIWIAANSDAAVLRAARVGDAWFMNPHTRLSELERQAAMFHAARSDAGRPPVQGFPVLKEVCIAPTDEEAWVAAKPYLERKYTSYVAWGQDKVMPSGESLQGDLQELSADDRFILGSPETCIRQIRRHIEQVGIDQLVCRFQWPGAPQETVLRSMRLLAKEVLPAFVAS